MDTRDTLLLACGTSASRAKLRTLFETDFNLLEADNSRQTKMLLAQNHSCIAVVILDLTAPEKIDALLFKGLEKQATLHEIPVVIITDPDDPESRLDIFEKGATDVYTTNTHPHVLQRRILNIVELYRHKWHLEKLVAEQTEILRHSNDAMVDALSAIIEYRNLESGQHILRIRRFTQVLLEEIARTCPEYNLTPETILIISSASALHDIGKISVPDSVLNKPGKLTFEECNIMKTHSAVGCRIVESLTGIGNEEYLRYAHNICHYHHERWDGKGYPEGLAGDDIPICAQVVGLADAYDALTTDRVYKKAYSFEKALNMIVNGECGTFSPKLLECFKQVSNQFEELARAYSDGLSPNTESFDVTLPPPSMPENRSSLDSVQRKYLAMLHHTNATVLEVELDQGLCHLVYNPDPNLPALRSDTSFQEVQKILLDQLVIPNERPMLEKVLYQDIPRFFQDGLHRQVFHLKLRSLTPGIPALYRVTLLRYDTNDLDHRRMLVLWERENPGEGVPFSISSDAIVQNTTDFPYATSVLCRNDTRMTLGKDKERLSSLVGYSAHELEEQFQSSLVELAIPHDRQMIRPKFDEQLSHSNFAELSYQVYHKSGHPIWILHKAYLTTDSDGYESLHNLLVDVTRVKSAQANYALSLEQYQLILAQTGLIVFDWDLISDTIHFSRTWQDIFGYSPVRDHARKVIYTESHFHPDDIPWFLDWLDAHTNHENPPAIEVRIVTSEGRYLWCRFRGTVSFDAEGTPSHLMGTITNIDSEKRASKALQQQANQDSLTKLLNKQAGRKQIEDFLFDSAPDTNNAMLIIDLDNFKQINDRFGHMFGDAVLLQVSKELQRLFRSHDIISRIGGDEFLVFMQNVPDLELVEKRCGKLLSNFNQLFPEQLQNSPLGCSIGIALSPTHGISYQDLFQSADQALYQAKGLGKNCYAIYNPNTSFQQGAQQLPAAHTSIDSENLPGLANSSLVQYAFRHLYGSSDADHAVNDILALMGEQLNVSRVYVFENTPDNKFCNNTYEWCNAGIPPEKENLQNISYETDIPNYEDCFNEHGIFYCPDIATLPQHLRDILEPQGIKSLLHCAIRDKGVFRGYIGFDDCKTKRLWTKEQIELLTFFSEILGVFLLKKQAQEELSLRADALTSILDSQDKWLYVIDPDTCELRFLNAKIRNYVPHAAEGMRCHKVLMGLDERCSDCPAKDIQITKRGEETMVSDLLGISIHSTASLIRWGGKDACLLNCQEVPASTQQE